MLRPAGYTVRETADAVADEYCSSTAGEAGALLVLIKPRISTGFCAYRVLYFSLLNVLPIFFIFPMSTPNTPEAPRKTRLISSQEYDEWVMNWKKQEYSASTPAEWSQLFMRNDRIQTGVKFDFEELSYLLSTPGVTTIKIRFGLRKWQPAGMLEERQQFQLLLFGADNANEIVTPYFTSDAFTYYHNQSQSNDEGNLPQALMRQWEGAWYLKARKNDLDQTMFVVRYGLLQGYNYPIAEIMSALCAFKRAADIQIRFGLHRYYNFEEVSQVQPAILYTFGVILYASLSTATTDDQGGDVDGAIEDSGYYDLTAPCPRTC